jgi:hypothetical protein
VWRCRDVQQGALGLAHGVDDSASGADVQNSLDDFVVSLGVTLERSTSTYDSLLQAVAV